MLAWQYVYGIFVTMPDELQWPTVKTPPTPPADARLLQKHVVTASDIQS